MTLFRSRVATSARTIPGSMKLWIAGSVLAIAMAGCGGGEPPRQSAPPPPPAAAPPAPPTPPPPPAVTQPPTTTPPADPAAPPEEAETPPPDPEGQWSAAAGTTVGAAEYPVPSDAIIVSPSGSDSAPGTVSAPLRTLGRAVGVASPGATIVLREGVYHESVVFYKRLTIQNWPGETVWFDGSVRVTDWVVQEGRWRHDGWTVKFDSSPTYKRGAPDSDVPNWQFVNPAYPMAAHPDQIWIDGVAQRQVGSLAEVVPGTFYHDEANYRLWLGSDPNGKVVRASALVRALMVRSENSTIRGIGVRRYAPSVPDMGSVTIERRGVTVEHVAIIDAATTGLHIGSHEDPRNVTLRNVHIAGSGMLGISATWSDNLTLERVLSEDNNTERFNTAPVSGGAKIGRSRHVTVRDSIFRDNRGPGLWMDVSVYDMIITGNEMRDNFRHGTSLEISAKAAFANNLVTNNGGFGIKINNTSDVAVWNNTFIGNGRSINIVQDARRPSNFSSGRDPRQPFPDPTMTWVNGPVSVHNNVMANQRSPYNSNSNCVLCVEDYSPDAQRLTAEQMRVTANNNVYHRPTSNAPSWLVAWSRGSGNPYVFTTLDAFRGTTGQEAAGLYLGGAAVVDANGSPTAAMPSSSNARPLPASIAVLIGEPAGAQHLGAWSR